MKNSIVKINSNGFIFIVVTIGDHIRKKRLDLGLTQIEVAEIIGVKESTVWNWEHETEPELRHIPKIIEFLGYVPFECPEDTIGKLRYFKLAKRQEGKSQSYFGHAQITSLYEKY